MTELVDRIEAATARLAEQQQRIATSLAALGEAEREFDGSGLREVQEALPALESAIHQLAADVQELPGHVETTMQTEIGAINSAMEDAQDEFSTRWSMLENAFDHLVESLTGLPDQAAERLSAFPELLETQHERFSQSAGELERAIESAARSLEELIASQIEQSGQEVEQTLEQLQQMIREKVGGRIESLAADGQTTIQRAFGDMSRLAERGGEELDRAAQAVFNALEEEVGRAIDQKFPDAQRELIDHAVRALGEEIIEGIAMSTVGAEISAALSPYLVYLIALKEALELVLQAIRLFKNPLEELL